MGIERIRALPCWRGGIAAEPLRGGLSNESWKVTDAAGAHVARFGEDFPFHHVARANEVMAARAAHRAGFAPEVEYAAPGVMVSRFLAARTWGEADLRADPERVGRFLAEFHRRMAGEVSGPGVIFWVFHVIRDYCGTLVDAAHRLAGDLPRLLALAERLEEAVGAIDLVFGHNDLLPGNFLDDGARLWLVDWDYAGFNSPLFDLGGLASNNEFPPALEAELLARYFGAAPDAGLLRRYGAMKCASLLRETLWSMVSELHSTLDFDYRAYTAENLRRFEAAWDAFQR